VLALKSSTAPSIVFLAPLMIHIGFPVITSHISCDIWFGFQYLCGFAVTASSLWIQLSKV